MATANHGAFTATMTFATAAQAGHYDRYLATRETLREMMNDLTTSLENGSISSQVFQDKMACLTDLYAQNKVQWNTLRPAIMWHELAEIEPLNVEGEIIT